MDARTSLDAVVTLAEQTNESALLERLVEVAGGLVQARYAAALLLGTDGQPCAVAHRGMSDAQVAALPHLPRPVGLLAPVLRGRTLRPPDLAAHPESVGLPAGHAPMGALLGVPLTGGGRVLGGLYLTRSPGAAPFTVQDERSATSAARLAASSLDALRRRLAHERLLDRLGAVDTRGTDLPRRGEVSPAIRRLLATAREVLGMELAFLSRLDGDRQTLRYFAAQDGSPRRFPELPEGTTVAAAESHCSLLVAGRIPESVPDVAGHPLLGPMAVTSIWGIGSYCGTPVHLPDGTLYGTLCGVHPDARAAPSGAQLETLRILARLIGEGLQREADHEQARQAAVRALTPMVDGTRRRVVLQPIVDLVTGAVAGYEALSRFCDPTGAPRAPDGVFAEAHALDIGLRLEQAAVASALDLLPRLPAGTYLSVNLSPQAVLDPATFDLLAGALAGPGRIVLELTEHAQVPDYPALLNVLDRLRARGLRVAVDDTGAGFASLQHVTALCPDIVKLDIAFVRGVDRDPTRRAVARAMVALAAELGADLVAEGIETAPEHDQLVRLGARYGQGYHLGRPQPPASAYAAALCG